MTKFALYQLNSIVGDINGNVNKILSAINKAIEKKCDIFLLPELAICGYPPEDLLLHKDFIAECNCALTKFFQFKNIYLFIPCPFAIENKLFNSVYLIYNGEIINRYDKMILPNTGVFDEKRYFTSGTQRVVFNCNNTKIGLVICEDMWQKEVITQVVRLGAEIICVINASPFEVNKHEKRIEIAKDHVLAHKIPLIYLNSVGAQDELVFDGASFAISRDGELSYQMPSFTEKLDYITELTSQIIIPYPSFEERIYNALVLATQDYVNKNKFSKVILGLSGGIDSALVLSIAVDALGSERVVAAMMNSKYTAPISVIDAKQMALNLGVEYHQIAIDNLCNQFDHELAEIFLGKAVDITEENIQARTRAVILMALSNKFGYLVLTTGNKSELAVGYTTLYGDMAGGFAVIKDVLKTDVYKLALWRNLEKEIIPQRIIIRPPSAELRENQLDQDSLPPYNILDNIIIDLVEKKLSAKTIAIKYKQVDVSKIEHLIRFNEYKRRQGAIGPKISNVAFGRDWRYPIINYCKN